MKKRYRTVIGSACLVMMLSLVAPAYGESGRELFDKLCSDCHTIGSGDKGGPDLAQVAERRPEAWLAQIIADPEKLTAAQDPVHIELTRKYGMEMPNLGISRGDVIKVIAFLKEMGKAGGGQPTAGKAAAEQPVPKERLVTPELVARGRALFTGAAPFAGGGAPCAACHSFRAPGITGGNLAKDLSDHYQKMGEQAFQGVLKSLKFPVMKKIYADQPLADDEISALIIFAKDAAAGKKVETPALFPLAGFGLFACCIGVLFLYKRRIR